MSTQPFEPKANTPLAKDLVQIGADPQAALEAIIQQRLAEEKARLEREAGVVKKDYHQFKKPKENPLPSMPQLRRFRTRRASSRLSGCTPRIPPHSYACTSSVACSWNRQWISGPIS